MAEDWKASDRKLHKVSVSAIKRFAKEHPDAKVCCFFFDCDEPRYGHIYISLDTLGNNIQTAKEIEQFAIQNRRKNLRGKLNWQWAKYQLRLRAKITCQTAVV